MSELGVFPFGEKVRPVEQADRSPKKGFILGVYASTVHARWLEDRREQIWDEFVQSGAEILVLLDDKPTQWFFAYLQSQYRRLSDFGKESYGRVHSFGIRGQTFGVLPVVHPRQASQLGRSSAEWAELHQTWITEVAGGLL